MRHDIEAKAKQTCAQEIKRLNQKITKIKLDTEKYIETLTECQTYKQFLIELRPKMWQENQSETDFKNVTLFTTRKNFNRVTPAEGS